MSGSLLGFWQEHRVAEVVEQLLARVKTRATVVRGGVRKEVTLGAVVPSDRVRLYAYLNAVFETRFSNPPDEAIRREPLPEAARYRKTDEVPYDFVRRRLSVLVESEGRSVMITRGALENVLEVCAAVELPDGSLCPIERCAAGCWIVTQH